MKKVLALVMCCCLALTACSDKKENTANTAANPDVGQIEMVTVTAKGMGATPSEAVNAALKSAVMQANGATMAVVSAGMSGGKQVSAQMNSTGENGQSQSATIDVKSKEFAEMVIAKSAGQIASFKVLDLSQSGQTYTVEIEAKVAKYKAPNDGKLRIVVAPLRSSTATFDIGGKQVPAEEILNPIRQHIIDALIQSGRFTVLDRQFDTEIQNELNMISSGQTTSTDFAKLGQALSADVVWVGSVNNLGYNKHTHTQRAMLMNVTKTTVNYNGGWSVSQRLINLATRQIMQSNTLQGTPAPSKGSFNVHAFLKDLENDIAKKATASIIQEMFPISIAQINGNSVVLSQGGQSVKQGARYQLYKLGDKVKDPQTGRVIGNLETPFGEVVVTRVMPNLSYGVLENVQGDIASVKPGELLVKEQIKGAPAVATAPAPGDAQQQAAPPAAAKAKPKKSAGKKSKKRDDDW